MSDGVQSERDHEELARYLLRWVGDDADLPRFTAIRARAIRPQARFAPVVLVAATVVGAFAVGGLLAAERAAMSRSSQPAATVSPATTTPAEIGVAIRSGARATDRVTGTQIGEYAPSFTWTINGETYELDSDLRSEVLLFIAADPCAAACQQELSAVRTRAASQRTTARLILVLHAPAAARAIRQVDANTLVLADANGVIARAYGDPFGDGAVFVLSQDGRVAGRLAIPVDLDRLEAALALARTIASPSPIGTVASVSSNAIDVLLESPTLSAAYGRPTRFRVTARTVFAPTTPPTAPFGLSRGDRVAIAWTVSTEGLEALTVSK